MDLRLSWRQPVALEVYGVQALEVYGVQVDGGEVPIAEFILDIMGVEAWKKWFRHDDGR